MATLEPINDTNPNFGVEEVPLYVNTNLAEVHAAPSSNIGPILVNSDKEPTFTTVNPKATPTGRVLRLYGWVYPFFGLYYSLRHPLLVGPHLLLPAVKTGAALSVAYPILSRGFHSQSVFIRTYLASTRFNRFSWLIIAGLWILQRGWLQYFVYDRLIKYFARGLLLKVYRVVSGNLLTISICCQDENVLNSGRLQSAATSAISAPIGETPRIQHRPVSTTLVNGISRALYFVVPSKKGFWSFTLGRLIPNGLLYVLPPGVGAISYALTAGPTRALSLIQPYLSGNEGFFASSERSSWTKRHSLPLRFLGASATLLEMVPFVGPMFAFTNTVGAGIWLATYFPPVIQRPTLYEPADIQNSQ